LGLRKLGVILSYKDLPVVYGGPYNNEIDALTNEINLAKGMDQKPNFDNAIKGWDSISQGALNFIKVNGEPEIVDFEPQFIESVLFDTIPEQDYQPEKVVGDIDMPAPLEGFSPVETFEASDEPIFEDEETTE
jgi:hypothetical protein